MMIVSTLVVVATVITVYYKISIHSLALWGIIGIILPLNKSSDQGLLLVPTVIVILIAGLVMSSRLLLDTHTPREVMFGGMLGFAMGFIGVVLLF